MFSNKIPTARFKICTKLNDVKKFLVNCNFPVVVKADGLAAGKGVTICDNRNDVIYSTSEIFKGKFKSSKSYFRRVSKGEEASFSNCR